MNILRTKLGFEFMNFRVMAATTESPDLSIHFPTQMCRLRITRNSDNVARCHAKSRQQIEPLD